MALAICKYHSNKIILPTQYRNHRLFVNRVNYNSRVIIQPSIKINDLLFSWRKYIPESTYTSQFFREAMEMNSDAIHFINLNEHPELHDYAYALNPIVTFMAIQTTDDKRLIELLQLIKSSNDINLPFLSFRDKELYLIFNSNLTKKISCVNEDIAKLCCVLSHYTYGILSESLKEKEEMFFFALTCASREYSDLYDIVQKAPHTLLTNINIRHLLLQLPSSNYQCLLFDLLPEKIKIIFLPDVIRICGKFKIDHITGSERHLFKEPLIFTMLLHRLSELFEQINVEEFSKIIYQSSNEKICKDDTCVKLIVDIYLRYITQLPHSHELSFKSTLRAIKDLNNYFWEICKGDLYSYSRMMSKRLMRE